MDIKIGIVGLGYVGLPLAVEFGKSVSVVGYDNSERRVEELSRGLDITGEVPPSEIAEAAHLELASAESALSDVSVFIITVPTPVDSANRPDLQMVISATRTVAKFLRPGSIVVYESTVYPGVTDTICAPILSEISGLPYLTETTENFPAGFCCVYSPERINPGDQLHRLTSITKIVGGSTRASAEFVANLYRRIISAGVVVVGSIQVAEAAKVIENTQRDINIAFVNELSIIFSLMGIDTCEVLDAASTKWNFLNFRPGLVGGHCIGVDPYYLSFRSEQLGYIPEVILAGRRVNDSMAKRYATHIVKRMINNKVDLQGSRIAVLGCTFKENCPDIRNSKVFDMISELASWGVSVSIFDPIANAADVKDMYGYDIAREIAAGVSFDAIIVAVSHDMYRVLKGSYFRERCKPNHKIVFGDLKSIFDRSELEDSGFDVIRL